MLLCCHSASLQAAGALHPAVEAELSASLRNWQAQLHTLQEQLHDMNDLVSLCAAAGHAMLGRAQQRRAQPAGRDCLPTVGCVDSQHSFAVFEGLTGAQGYPYAQQPLPATLLGTRLPRRAPSTGVGQPRGQRPAPVGQCGRRGGVGDVRAGGAGSGAGAPGEPGLGAAAGCASSIACGLWLACGACKIGVFILQGALGHVLSAGWLRLRAWCPPPAQGTHKTARPARPHARLGPACLAPPGLTAGCWRECWGWAQRTMVAALSSRMRT